MEPILDRLAPGTSTLCIIPHRGLGVLPLHAVPVNGMASQTHLASRFAVVYAASLSEITTPRLGHASATRSLLTIRPAADPPLHFAERECAAVREHFEHHLHLGGNDASRRQVAETVANFTYAHFACHGTADWNDIGRSAVTLSDGGLTMDELCKRDLGNVRLVCLSACETGIVDFKHLPNASIGMATSLREAGANSVLSALWTVSDAATFLTMKAFYTHHLRGHLEPGAALARAQEWLRDLSSKDVVAELGAPVATVGADSEHPFSEPFYWAPFRINGL